VVFFIPLRRGDDVAGCDPRIVEDTGQPVEERFVATEGASSAFLGFGLTDPLWRNGGGEREKAAGMHHRTLERERKQLVQFRERVQ
jgi:hypothetical protein